MLKNLLPLAEISKVLEANMVKKVKFSTRDARFRDKMECRVKSR